MRWFFTFAPVFFFVGLACIYTYRLEIPETRTQPARVVRTLEISGHNGAVTAQAVEDTLITVVITRYAYGRDSADARQRLERITVADTLDNATWSISADIPRVRQPLGVQFAIAAPGTVGLSLATSNGTVTVRGFQSQIRVTTSNSAVVFNGNSGDAQITTTNGPVTVQAHSGGVTVSTSNGAIECDLVEVSARGAVQLSTSNAGVTLWLPADVSALIEATTTNGTVVLSGFAAEYQEESPTHIRARIGSGASTITINTTNGDVVIKRRSTGVPRQHGYNKGRRGSTFLPLEGFFFAFLPLEGGGERWG